MHRPVSRFNKGQAPSADSGSSLRPLARTAFAATIASPLVRYGVKPVS